MSKVLAFGEIMMRLAAVDGTIAESKVFEACYGGTEANVLACMSGLGHDVKYLTGLPDTELGHAVLRHLHRFDIDTSNVLMRGDVLGLYFVEDGTASRGSNVIYMRKYSQFTTLTEDDFDYGAVFDGVSLFHVSGISFALSDSSRALAYRLCKEARLRGVKISFDFNYRAKLWSLEEARNQLVKAASYADILLASSLDVDVFLQMKDVEVFDKFPCQYLILRDRKVLSKDEHSVKVKVLNKTNSGIDTYVFNETPFPVLEKIGGGDAFDGCMLHALMSGFDLRQATLFGVAGFMLKHKQAGDTFTADEREITELANLLGEQQ